MITIAELMALPFEEARAKIDALTVEELKVLAPEAADRLVEILKEIIEEVQRNE